MKHISLFALSALLLLLCACSPNVAANPDLTPTPPPTATPEATVAPTATPTATPTVAPEVSPTATPEATVAPEVSPAATATPTVTDAPTGAVAPEGTVPPTSQATEAFYTCPVSVPATAAVGDDYFADAVFIGDSRTDGLKLYGGLKTATYLSGTSLSVFNIDKKQISHEGNKVLALDALAKKQYGKVYLSLGLNELGWDNDQEFHDFYAMLVDKIKEIQPDAVVYVQQIIPVNTQKCKDKEAAGYITNQQILVYNKLIAQIATEKSVVLLNPGEALVDATGEPPYDATGDGVHFQKSGYPTWIDYLRTHTATKEAAK